MVVINALYGKAPQKTNYVSTRIIQKYPNEYQEELSFIMAFKILSNMDTFIFKSRIFLFSIATSLCLLLLAGSIDTAIAQIRKNRIILKEVDLRISECFVQQE